MKSKAILYIEDSGVDRELVRQVLEAEGHKVFVTGEPDEGIELARNEDLDLILIDLHLPEMDGSLIAEYLRKIPGLDAVPIIALSASIKEEEKEELLAPFDGFVTKPITVESFPARILDLIKGGRGAGEPVAPQEEKEKGSSDDLLPETRQALEALESVRAAMSHDLRTPLTVMISYANTVGREKVGPLNEKQKEMLDMVVDHGFKMDELISELVRIARKTLDHFDYPPKPKE
jgi:two-component system cell cycle response regulator DivK